VPLHPGFDSGKTAIQFSEKRRTRTKAPRFGEAAERREGTGPFSSSRNTIAKDFMPQRPGNPEGGGGSYINERAQRKTIAKHRFSPRNKAAVAGKAGTGQRNRDSVGESPFRWQGAVLREVRRGTVPVCQKAGRKKEKKKNHLERKDQKEDKRRGEAITLYRSSGSAAGKGGIVCRTYEDTSEQAPIIIETVTKRAGNSKMFAGEAGGLISFEVRKPYNPNNQEFRAH